MPMRATATGEAALREQILALLPRTDCGACGYSGCEPYAAAVVAGAAAPTHCTPGGALLAARLRRLLDQTAPRPTLAEFLDPLPRPQVARIRAADCIGCTKCLEPCPVDAIVGARGQLHGILEEDCTGCGRCLPPCPVDCIELVPREPPPAPGGARDVLAAAPEIDACTDCGRCAPACPQGLEPQRLARALRSLNLAAAEALSLAQCTECALCDAVCPPHIPLTAYFTHGKALVADAERAAEDAARALARRTASVRRRTRSPDAGSIGLVELPADRDAAATAVAAALARARRGRGG